MIQTKVLKKIKEYDKVVIFGHIRPDGDCFGAQIGLKSILQNTYKNKKVFVVGEKSDYVSFLGEIDIIDDNEMKDALAVILDTATLERVGDSRYNLCKEIVRIDHHLGTSDYGDVQWVEKISSTCQMIASLLVDFPKLKIDEKGATALYTGMVTDTGRFKYLGVDGKTMKMAGLLIDRGAKPHEIDAYLSEEIINVAKLKGHVLCNMKTTEKGFLYYCLTLNECEAFNVTKEQASSVVDILANIKDYPVWALFVEADNGVRIRLRSRGPRVDFLANQFQGGGHALASGASLKSFDEVPVFCQEVDKVIVEWEKEKASS